MTSDTPTAIGGVDETAPVDGPPSDAPETTPIPEVLFTDANFLCGGAGCGKTWIARALSAQYDGVLLCATTGIASVNLGEGTTINAALKYFDTKSLQESYLSGHLVAVLGKLYRSGVRRLVIDEVSMQDADQTTIIVQALEEFADRRYTRDHALRDEVAESMQEEGRDIQAEWPIKLTYVGDFAQLGPVKAEYAFTSPEWPKIAQNLCKLTTIRRQADRDFITALRAARSGDADTVCDYFGPRLLADTDNHYEGPTILATNDAVDRYNRLRLGKVPGALAYYPSTRWGKERGDWKLIPPDCGIKVGALVMILANKRVPPNPEQPDEIPRLIYSNGDLGVVEDVDVAGKRAYVRLHRTGEPVEVDYITRWNTIPLEPGRLKQLVEAGEHDRIQRDRRGKAIAEIIGGIDYLPLRVAYGATVHKCQGLSFDRVQVSTREGMFKMPGLLYVALSRARTIDGLRLIGTVDGLRQRCVIDARIRSWL